MLVEIFFVPCLCSVLLSGLCPQAVETLKTFEKKDSRVKSAAATNLSFLFFLVKILPSVHHDDAASRRHQVHMRVAWQEKDYDQADRYADLAMNADRYNPAALNNKGNTVFSRHDYEKAAEFYKEALRNDSSCTEALYNLGVLLFYCQSDRTKPTTPCLP